MQRPIMNPTFVDEGPTLKPRWTARLRPAWRGLCWSARLLLTDVLGGRSKLKVDVGSPLGRLARGLCYRALFVPAALVLLSSALVFSGTHPPTSSPGAIDPACHGLNYDPVEFLGEGGVRIEGWLVPVLDAKRVIAERDKTLGDRRPAVVLVHDYGASRQQMLPLVRPLHEAGYVVLVTTLRGSTASPAVGSTFGLNESGDVQAAVTLLRRSPFVNGSKVALIGVGTGANASLMVAQKDTALAALVLDKPLKSFDDTLREHLGPRQPWMRWVNPLCQWTFDIAYGVNSSELNLQQNFHTLQGRSAKLPILLYDGPSPTCLRPSKARSVVDFLDAAFGTKRGAGGVQSADASGSSAP